MLLTFPVGVFYCRQAVKCVHVFKWLIGFEMRFAGLCIHVGSVGLARAFVCVCVCVHVSECVTCGLTNRHIPSVK